MTATATTTIAIQRMVLARLLSLLGCMANAFMASAPFHGIPRLRGSVPVPIRVPTLRPSPLHTTTAERIVPREGVE